MSLWPTDLTSDALTSAPGVSWWMHRCAALSGDGVGNQFRVCTPPNTFTPRLQT